MSDTERYEFQSGRDPFSGNGSISVTDTSSDATVHVHIKDGMWAVDVKDRNLRSDLPQASQDAADLLGDNTAEAIYRESQEAFWVWAQEAAADCGFEKVYSTGRSSGWLAVDGTQDWDPAELLRPTEDFLTHRDAFLKLAFETAEMIGTFRFDYETNLVAAANVASEHGTSATEPIRVLAVLWDDEAGPNCDLYRNKPVLLAQLGTHYEGVCTDAINHPGQGFNAEGVTGTVRYLTVKEA